MYLYLFLTPICKKNVDFSRHFSASGGGVWVMNSWACSVIRQFFVALLVFGRRRYATGTVSFYHPDGGKKYLREYKASPASDLSRGFEDLRGLRAGRVEFRWENNNFYKESKGSQNISGTARRYYIKSVNFSTNWIFFLEFFLWKIIDLKCCHRFHRPQISLLLVVWVDPLLLCMGSRHYVSAKFQVPRGGALCFEDSSILGRFMNQFNGQTFRVLFPRFHSSNITSMTLQTWLVIECITLYPVLSRNMIWFDRILWREPN